MAHEAIQVDGDGASPEPGSNQPTVTFGEMTHRLPALILLAALAIGCSGEVALPDRTDEAVQSEETRISDVLESTDDIWAPGDCEVRLLGQQDDSSYAWADCDDGDSGWSGPVLVQGDQVSTPRDGGAFFSDDVLDMFPAPVAEAILERPQELRP